MKDIPLNGGKPVIITDALGKDHEISQNLIDELQSLHNIDAIAEIKRAIEQDREFIKTLKEQDESKGT